MNHLIQFIMKVHCHELAGGIMYSQGIVCAPASCQVGTFPPRGADR